MKLSFINNQLDKIKKTHLYRNLLYSRILGPYIAIEKKRLVNLSSNDYLGLGSTTIKTIQSQSSSRLVSGNDILFKSLESRLAFHKSQQSALVFPTGYMANLGMISILPQKGDLIISDELNHASIIDSCKLAHAKKTVYKHNSISDLETKLQRKARNKFVITEGIFSMSGDFAKLKEISTLCTKYDATLILDDAHGDFVVGQDGKGTAKHFGVENEIGVYISSLSKGLGAFGGYVASKSKIIEFAVNTSRPFIYTSALPNFMVQIALNNFRHNREQKRIKLWKNIRHLRSGLESFGYVIDSDSQIMPIIIGGEKKTIGFSRYLFNNGIFCLPIRYPTVSLGYARIRISVTAWLTETLIERTLDTFEKAGKKFGIL